MLVELKNGETLNGHLIACDTWMNLTMRDVVQTNPNGDKFMRLAEAYVRGNNVRLAPTTTLLIAICANATATRSNISVSQTRFSTKSKSSKQRSNIVEEAVAVVLAVAITTVGGVIEVAEAAEGVDEGEDAVGRPNRAGCSIHDHLHRSTMADGGIRL